MRAGGRAGTELARQHRLTPHTAPPRRALGTRRGGDGRSLEFEASPVHTGNAQLLKFQKTKKLPPPLPPPPTIYLKPATLTPSPALTHRHTLPQTWSSSSPSAPSTSALSWSTPAPRRPGASEDFRNSERPPRRRFYTSAHARTWRRWGQGEGGPLRLRSRAGPQSRACSGGWWEGVHAGSLESQARRGRLGRSVLSVLGPVCALSRLAGSTRRPTE